MLKLHPDDIPFVIATIVGFVITVRMLFLRPSKRTIFANILVIAGIAAIWIFYVKAEGNVSNTQTVGAFDLMLSLLLYLKIRVTIVQLSRKKTKKHSAKT